MDVIEVARTLNGVLGVALVTVCMARIFRDWPHFSHRDKVVRVHLVAYLACISYAAAEQVALNAEPGARSLLYLAVHVSFALALWRTRHDPVRG